MQEQELQGLQGLAQVTAQIERMAIQKITAEQDLKPVYINVPGDAKKRYVIFDPVKKTTTDPQEPIAGYINFELETPGQLLAFIESEQVKEMREDASIFYNEKNVVLVLDIQDRRDVVTVPLVKSPVWKLLESNSGNGPAPMMQKEFIRLLRVTLKGCAQDAYLLNVVRNLKFSSAGTVEANIQHQGESLGKNINNQVAGTTDIPEEISLTVQVFENHGFRASILCAVEIDLESRQFKITPYPLVMKQVMDAALDDVANLFHDEDVPPIYRGKP